MNKTQAGELIKKFNEGNASAEEIKLLERWYIHEVKLQQTDPESLDYAGIRNEMWHQIQQSKNKQVKPLWPRIAAVASIFLILSFGIYFLNHKLGRSGIIVQQVHDLAPGSNKATLILANGREILINGSKAGLLAQQGSVAVNLTADNGIVYQKGEKDGSVKMEYNTMTTPRGGQYPLTLSDGTKVWLDASSSITYPVAFVGNNREVKITGQVYFEVAHNPAKPFRVATEKQVVEVLGTHFNINAYPDEPLVVTTLFEGSVRIAAAGGQAILKPGEQAQVKLNTINVTEHADLDQAIAWHKGLFKFHDADIPAVMRQLARWYDVDVEYDGPVSDQRFSGEIYRSESALKVSDILSYAKIHFRIEGKKIIVTP